jgi:valacyclovir hydrolase
MPFVDLPTGARLHYEDIGEGEPLIALHGRLGTARRDLGSVIDWLSADFRVIGPSMRGYGESGPKPRDFPLDFYHRDARDVHAFMDALEIERAHVVGYSDGGEIALALAGLYPERCLSVAVWGAVGYFGPDMRPVAQRSYPPTWLSKEDMDFHGIPNADAFALSWIRAVKHMIDSGGDVSLSLAPNITCPVLLMLGVRDTLNPEAYGRAFIDKVRDGRLVMFDSGHAVHEEQWERFKEVVGAFLAQVRGKR